MPLNILKILVKLLRKFRKSEEEWVEIRLYSDGSWSFKGDYKEWRTIILDPDGTWKYPTNF